MYQAYKLPPVTFDFGDKRGSDKFRGLQNFGPYRSIMKSEPPKFGFVFPSQYRDQANRLFLALKNGIGYFRGVESTFRFPLHTEQVFPVTEFSIQPRNNPHDTAQIYAEAILSWVARNRTQPDMFFILHPRTSRWEGDTPYYKCKALLLQEGIISQNVTFDLLNKPTDLEWSVANIALAAFVKLGGIPWIISSEESDQEMVIGVGKAHLFDSHTREITRFVGFTVCFSTNGLFKFSSIGHVAKTNDEYLEMLWRVVNSSLDRAEQLSGHVMPLTLHVSKEMSRDELKIISKAVQDHNLKHLHKISILKITDESQLFVVDEHSKDGVPQRGTVIQTSDQEYMLYTEGREEQQSWRQRIPTALRIVAQGYYPQLQPLTLDAIRHVNELSQVNWRGFNAKSRPISIYYGRLIADILKHIPAEKVGDLFSEKSLKILEERMWFL